VSRSISIASNISNRLAEDIISEVVERTDTSEDESVRNVVSNAVDDGLISEDEEEEILQPLKRSVEIRPSVRPKNTQPMKRNRIKHETDIERLLREIQKPEGSVSNVPSIQYRIFKCLGLIN
jgi:polyhydroxyalkanoate synthesis regulator phasin